MPEHGGHSGTLPSLNTHHETHRLDKPWVCPETQVEDLHNRPCLLFQERVREVVLLTTQVTRLSEQTMTRHNSPPCGQRGKVLSSPCTQGLRCVTIIK